jgi:hypothetical protein
MLKRILFLCGCLLSVLHLEAQDRFKASTCLGINAGLNMSRVSFTPTVNQKLLNAASAGLFIRHLSEPHIGLQIEVNYAGKGWIENLDSIGTYERDLHVINVPLQAVFVAGSRAVRFAFTLGPYLSWLMDEKEIISIPNTQDYPYLSWLKDEKEIILVPNYKDYKDYYQKKLPGRWEFGFTGGFGIELYTKLGAFSLRASYNHSLTNLFPLNADTFYFNASRSQVIYLGLTYFITL